MPSKPKTKKKVAKATTKKPYSAMVAQAIKDIADGETRKFVSYIAIAKYVGENFDVNPSTYRLYVRRALATGVTKDILIKKRASYRARIKKKPAAKKKRKTATKKKTTTRKTTTRAKPKTTTRKTKNSSRATTTRSAKKSTTTTTRKRKATTKAASKSPKKAKTPVKSKKRKPKLTKEGSRLLARGEVFHWAERNMAKVFVGLGWNTSFDLDASLCLFDEEQNCLETISYRKLKSSKFSIVHSGDIVNAKSSKKEGDQERIVVDLNTLTDDVNCLVFVVHVYSGDKTFKDVPKAYIRLCDDLTTQEKCRYEISEKLGGHSALCFCKVFRDPDADKQWRFLPIGKTISGGGRTANAAKLAPFAKLDYVPK